MHTPEGPSGSGVGDESPPVEPRWEYRVRGCRGHFHVTSFDAANDIEGDDLWGDGDPFATKDAAQVVADALNRGEQWPSIDEPRAESPRA